MSVWVGQELEILGGLPHWAMVVIVCILVNIYFAPKLEKMMAVQVAGLTEITSNVATANILLPVLAEVLSDGSVLNLTSNFPFLYC